MSGVVLALVIAFLGTIAAAFWTFVIGLAGVPGAILDARNRAARPDALTISRSGLLLTVPGQLFASLLFVAFTVLSVQSLAAGGLGKALIWVAGWWVAGAPAWMALRDSASTDDKNVQHYATAFSAPLSFVPFFVFVFWPPALAAGFGWLPHL